MFGDDDVFHGDGSKYTTSVQCYSKTGRLLIFQRRKFLRLQKNEAAWTEILKQIAYKKFRQCADDIDTVSDLAAYVKTQQEA